MANFAAIKGGAELARALKELPLKLEVRVMNGALRGGAKVIAEEAKRNVPVRTGALRESIKIRRRANKRAGFINYYVTAGGRKKGQAWYAHLVEFGAKAHEIRPAKAKSLFIAGLFREIVKHPGARAKPFLAPAFSSRAGDAVAEIIRLTKAGLERIARRGGR